MYIRQLQAQDWEAYRALRLRGLAEHPEAFGSSFEEESALPDDRWAERVSGDRTMLGAFVDDRLVGVAGLVQETKIKLRHKGMLVGMYVAPEVRRGGLARALVEEVLKLAAARKMEQVLLLVASENQPARALYEAMGFTSYGEEPRALKIGDRYVDEVYMIRQLPPS